MRLYDRQFSVVIGESDSDAVEIKSLAMTFEVKRISSSKPIEGFVSIVNLSDATDTFIRDKGQRIRLFGGYPDRVGLLFDGDVTRIERQRDGVDRITRVEFGGNLRKLTQSLFTRSYSGNVSIKDIVLDALPTMALSTSSTDVLPDKQKANFSFDGKTSDLLDKLLIPNGISWREESGVIVFSEIGKADGTVAVPVINSSSGLIGVPGQTEDGGVKIITLLNPFLSVGRAFKLESDVIGIPGGGRDQNVRAGTTDGIYKAVSLTHRGETRGVVFYTDVEGIAV